MLETELASLAHAVFAFLLKQSHLEEKVRTLLGRDPAKLAFQASLAAAWRTVQADCPQLDAMLFDDHFLHHGAGHILGRYLDGSGPPDRAELARAWADQLGQRVSDSDMQAVITAAETFLQVLERELRKYPEFAHVYQGRVLDTLTSIAQALHSIPVGELRKARDLALSSFSLGGDDAATFPYVTDPVRGCWEDAALSLKRGEQKAGRGDVLLLLGAANSGKTRLALEVVMATLPDWYVLRWRPDYTPSQIPSDAQLRGLDVIVFVDDLHLYVPHADAGAELRLLGTDPRALTFQTLVERVRAGARRSVVVVTCREDHEDDVSAALPHMFTEAVIVRLPTFDVDLESEETRKIVDMFAARGAQYCEEWDGTLGSLVLGLAKKRAQYLALRASPSGAILRAMKLLTLAGITQQTKSRIQLVCDKVFGEHRLATSPTLWESVVDELTRTQFVWEDVRAIDGALRLSVRKDSYLEEVVVSDYPNPRRSTQLDQHLSALRRALAEVEDVNGLTNLGVAYFDRHHVADALAIYSDVLEIDPAMAIAWQNKGNALYTLGRPLEALEASTKAIELEPSNALAWNNRGAILAGLNRHGEALAAFDHSLALDPTNHVTMINRCSVLTKLHRAHEALPMLEGMRVAQRENPTFWHNLGTTLQALSRWDEALEALDRPLELDPSNAVTLSNKMAVLGELERYEEALAVSEQVEDGSPGAEWVWHNRGRVLNKLGKPAAAVVAFDHALKIHPNLLPSLAGKSDSLLDLGRRAEALEIANYVVKVDPGSKEAWDHLGKIQLKLDDFKGAVLSFDCAIALDATYHVAWNNKGVAHGRLGELPLAAQAFQRAVEMNPTNLEAANNLEKAAAAMDSNDKAQQSSNTIKYEAAD